MDELLENFFGARAASDWGEFRPKIDVAETDDKIQVTAEVPGVADGDVEVELEGDVLTIRGEKRTEQEHREAEAHRVERSYGKFRRSLRLPCPVDAAAATARQKNGVLTIELPKAEPRASKHRITVSSEDKPAVAGPASGASAGAGEKASAANGSSRDPLDRSVPVVEDTSSTAGAGPQAAGIGLAAGAPRRAVAS
ncbi:MAG TPA: Hsp20/alpha crystallin family protein [Candidatus Binatia bacterium]